MRVRKVQEVICSDLPKQLENARRNADRSLLQICKRLDISPTYWYRLERGETDTINYDLIQKIEQELSCDFGIEFPDSPKRNSKKGRQGMDLSRLQWIKVITPPKDYQAYWAYDPSEIEKMKESNNQVINHNQVTIFPLGFRGKQTAKIELGDLIALKQHAKITHVVEVLDENFFGTDEWSSRYVKIIWWKPEMDWKNLPHAKDVLGIDITPMDGTPYLFDSFKAFRERWSGSEGLREFQALLANKLSQI